MQETVASRPIKHYTLSALIAIVAVSLVTCVLALNRDFLTFGVEQDFLWRFVPEAKRALQGSPLVLEYHPPFYALLLALVQSLVSDWVVSGLSISLVSSIFVLGTSFVFFYHLLGRHAALGATVFTLASPTFLTHAASAGSDLLFLAFYMACLTLALLTLKSNDNRLWFACGLLLGFGILTRSNGIILLPLLATPLLSDRGRAHKLRSLSILTLGFVVPLVAWASYALLTGSPLTASGNAANLAMTYFAPQQDRFSQDSLALIHAQFHSLADVLTHDPIHMLRTYAKDLYTLLFRAFSPKSGLFALPVSLFVVPGLFFLLLSSKKPLLWGFIGITVAHVLLVNFKTYEPRFYLFLVPVFGAAVAACYRQILISAASGVTKGVALAALVILALIAIKSSVQTAHAELHALDRELGEAVPAAQKWLPTPNCAVVARKGHLPFYAGCHRILFPNVPTLEELRASLNSQPQPNELYVYYGSAERTARPQFSDFLQPGKLPPWLTLIEKGKHPDGWVLLKYAPKRP